MKKKTFFIATLIITIFVLAACGTQVPSATEEPQPSQDTSTSENQPIITSGMSISNNILLDPALAEDADSQLVNGNLYETLVKAQGNTPIPNLAVSVIASEDGLAYTLNLRLGVTFHDGSPLNADAVIANFNRWFDPDEATHGSGSYDAWLDAFKGFKGEVTDEGIAKSIFDGAEKVDENTIILHLNTPDTDFVVKLANPAFSIVNPAALNADGFGTSSGLDGGTGPYMIGTFNDTSLTLVPYSDYWNPTNDVSENVEFSLDK